MGSFKILIVEDNLITAFHLEKLLTDRGFDVIDKLGHAEQVFDLIQDKLPHLILMDIMLLGSMSGIDASEKIRSISEVPIIFLSALSDSETRKRIHNISNTSTVQKPFDENQLIAKINSMITV